MSINKVNQKLFKSKKVDLKTRKVELGLIEEANEDFDNASGIDIVLDEFWEAVDVIRNADAYFYHQFRLDYDGGKLILDELEAKLDDLGIEYTPEMLELRERQEYLREKGNELAENLDWLKAQIGGYDKL